MVLKRAKCDLNGIKIAIFSAKLTQNLGATPHLWRAWVATICLARNLNKTIFVQKLFTTPLS